MCGINGFNFRDIELAEKMNESIKHRGPDGRGIFSGGNVTFGHVRLSIIDLSDAGHQPMFYSKNNGASSEKFNSNFIDQSNICITFNGEIYNFQEIRNTLENFGYKFTTGTDTEVILASYLEYGESCVNHFNGMWAFCIYDQEKNILFCSRDRLGVKPFYYFYDSNDFIFTSDLKGIMVAKPEIKKLNNINKESLELYFSLGFIPSPFSIFKNVYKLEASFNLTFNLKTKSLNKKQYYEISDFKPEDNKDKLIKEGKEILEDAVKIRMVADVPVGAFLSGGLDSSSVVAMMKKNTEEKISNSNAQISNKIQNLVHTFSIGFEGKYDETPFINCVKNYFKTNHHHYYFKESNFEKMIDIYSDIYSEPFADYSGFPTTEVSRLARVNVTVSLSGDGGDEIFGGYNTHKMGARMEVIYKIPRFLRKLLSKLPIKKNLNEMSSFYLLKEAFLLSLKPKENFLSDSLLEDAYRPESYKKWTSEKLRYALKKANGNLSEALRIHDLLYNTLQDNFLVKVDRASMYNSLEVRSPFLDYRFIDHTQSIPTRWKTNLFKTKILMRDIIRDLVPEMILNRGKQGFEPPIDKWINNEKHIDHLDKSLEILKEIDLDIYEFIKNKVFNSNNKLYTNYKIRLFIFSKWYDKYL